MPWPEAEVSWPKSSSGRPVRERSDPAGRLVIRGEDIPQAPHFLPPEGVPLVAEEAWRARDSAWKGSVLRFTGPAMSWGPFVWLTWRWEVPGGMGGSGSTIVLVRDGDGWRFIRASLWVS